MINNRDKDPKHAIHQAIEEIEGEGFNATYDAIREKTGFARATIAKYIKDVRLERLDPSEIDPDDLAKQINRLVKQQVSVAIAQQQDSHNIRYNTLLNTFDEVQSEFEESVTSLEIAIQETKRLQNENSKLSGTLESIKTQLTQVKGDQSAQINQLKNEYKNETEKLNQQLEATIGKKATAEHKLTDAEKLVDQLKEQLSELGSQSAQQNAEIVELSKQLAVRNSELTSEQSAHAKSLELINKLNQQVESLQSEMKLLESEHKEIYSQALSSSAKIAVQDATINAQQEQISMLKRQIDYLEECRIKEN